VKPYQQMRSDRKERYISEWPSTGAPLRRLVESTGRRGPTPEEVAILKRLTKGEIGE
jgi:hypothetical protein